MSIKNSNLSFYSFYHIVEEEVLVGDIIKYKIVISKDFYLEV